VPGAWLPSRVGWGKDNVAGLDIPMDDSVGMDELQHRQQAAQNFPDLGFGEAAPIVQ
jgi:hypothetical protein